MGSFLSEAPFGKVNYGHVLCMSILPKKGRIVDNGRVLDFSISNFTKFTNDLIIVKREVTEISINSENHDH